MSIRKTDYIITGTDPELRMNFYMTRSGMNVWRRASSLTGERTKTDPAFNGIRKSSSRLKQASPIAASLYKMVPLHVKQYTLFRTLTGNAIKMLKEGIDISVISETLKKSHIDPLFNAPCNNAENKTDEKSGISDEHDMNDFTSIPRKTDGRKKMSRRRRAILLHKITTYQSVADYLPVPGADALKQNLHVETIPAEPGKPKHKPKATDPLTYLGRLPECLKLKMWLAPVVPSSPA